ncbi:MAG: spore coat protein CotJB [Lachnospiraceae bacterium]|nr:spore coat protein CotJB [Lachnospiraceae bacterium]
MNREGYPYGNGRPARAGRMQQGRMSQDSRENFDAYNGNCGCGTQERPVMPESREFSGIPTENQYQLLKYIDEISFCAYDLMLYLDTHPLEEPAAAQFAKYQHQRDRAVKIYEEKYGPLRFGQPDDGRFESVKWVSQKWPWEGGKC